ncbi:laminin subunit alpha-like isoform X2 [Macrobrachium nipponense]|uniref:laminin subunit alpha-like isoform X2 n=1 Tax=Macrobrachium nipponense TaxID=159736 RepID=UPI0030C83EB8
MKDPGRGVVHTWTLFILWTLFEPLSAQVLTPPYFNLAVNRRITASSTCGVGVSDPELFCKLVGANADRHASSDLIQGGQFCDVCDPNVPEKFHPPEYAIDGSERWWQSPPLSRGMDYNQVNLTIDLGQLFQVAYIVIKMGNSPRPGVWALERSTDNGETYTPWQYYAGNLAECESFFGKESLKPIQEDDDVNCITHFSKVVPLEGGEIVVQLLNNRPSANSFFNSTTLQQFTRATNVRLRLLRTKTFLGHLMSVERADPTVTRRYFYSIKDISIGGRCVCNGHADVCDLTDPDDLYKLKCRCQHNTCGSQCERCCPGFIQKKWRPAGYHVGFVCEPCNCFGHTNECLYDEEVDEKNLSIDIFGNYEGGGVCQNCRHNTKGINCNECMDGYYRPYGKELNDTDVCQPCDCNVFYSTGNCEDGTGQCQCRPEFLPPYCRECNDGYYDYPDCKPCDCHKNGTIGGVCEVGGGQCPCKENYQGLNCDECAPGYYNFPECLPCDCSEIGTLDNSTCDIETGQCGCVNKFGGRKCDRCAHGYFDHPTCAFCNCDAQGTQPEICDKSTGECLCLEGFSGSRCDSNAPGFWGYPYIQICGCHERGSASTVCDASGDCACLTGFSGRACDQCSSGYYNFPDCIKCACDSAGSIGISCDKDGKCKCKPNYSGVHCDKCFEGFYNFPLCEECNCNPAGVLETFAGCGNAPEGELCECKGRVTGRICDTCRPLFWNLRQDNPEGCEECKCDTSGTVGGMSSCEQKSGQCFCKPGVRSRRCNECRDGTYNLRDDNMFGCTSCGCNLGGSVDNTCDKETGQCRCRPRVTGQHCDEPLQLHYFPTFYQLKYEAEEGRTPQNTAVRFGYDEDVYPNYSWRGYAVFSEIQKEIINDVYIEKPSLYRMVMSYHNPNKHTVVGKIIITPDDPLDSQQEVDVHFRSTSEPKLMTVVTVPGDFPVPLVMNPGRWSIAIVNDKNLFLDYFVLLPLAYYEGAILSENVTVPCALGQDESQMCVHYTYPDIYEHSYIYGSAGYRKAGNEREAVDLYDDEEVLRMLDTQPMAWLNHNQPEVQYDLRLGKSGHHILLINYYTPEGSPTTNVMIETSTRKGKAKGRAILYDCRYSTTCRQVITDLEGKVGVFPFDSNFVNVVVKGETNTNIGIESIVAVPHELWHEDLVRLQPVCARLNGECLTSQFPHPPETTKIEFENNLEGKRAAELPWGISNNTGLVFLNHSDPMVDITGKLRSAGGYVFIVHYYQPLYPEFEVDVLLQNGQFYEASLDVHHCPSTSGCRDVIRHPDGSYVFNVLENFVLSLKEPDHKSLWLDYLLVVPAEQFTQEILHELPQDRTAEFISLCGQDNFNLQPNASDFCRDAAFKLTTDYNSGALPCQCDFYGSASFECESFGGQCACKPNVIGRRCDRCKTGYFGFPDCKPCDCPSTALCDPVTGECICPPRVEGDRCERCSPYTYGFDPIIGCEECQCSPLGVKAGNLQCDMLTGKCDCKDAVVGRRCERCAAGYWSFPFCQLCDCDLRGTEAEICNQDNARCYCKSNVQGYSCENCVSGSYNLEESNPDGCTKCFCFGKTDSCSSSDMYWTKFSVEDMSEFRVVVLEQYLAYKGLQSSLDSSLLFSTISQLPEYSVDSVEQELGDLDVEFPESSAYFSLPLDYLGNRLTSYGGYLTYSLYYQVETSDGIELESPDVFLQGNNIIAQYFLDEQPENREPFNVSIRLTEHNFRTLSGASLKRDQFMTMLLNLEGIYIRANYWTNTTFSRLSDVFLDAPTVNWPGRGAHPALSVELCQCPVNYEGTSCERCADGYYRAQRGPYGGYCVPCQCNGHSNTCDKETGKCINCRHNTVGDYCELCGPGYHGKATQGTPYDCLICACPLPSITNNFAESCDVTEDGVSIQCNCRPGYVGRHCERCASGYYGRPETLGESCQPCECNGNIDANDPYACDDISGRCLSCLNNTFGNLCERCAPGFYGDAIEEKNCESCTCNECGTRNCQHFTGKCECFPNVDGEDCDRCAADHWGFASCQGCQPCQCGIAAAKSQCDEGTGQCICRDGATGQRCELCKPGYWNYTRHGCQACTCQEGFSVGVGCNPLTGQCSCLPGVVGANCDGCPYRWVLIEGYGCQECEECVHALLDTTDELIRLIEPTILEFKTAAHSYFLHQSLSAINSTVHELRPRVDLMDLPQAETHPIHTAIEDVFKTAQSISGKANILYDRADEASTNSFAVFNDALAVQKHVDDAFSSARSVIGEINRLVIGLETGTGAQLEQAIHEAEDIVDRMRQRDFSPFGDKAEVELEISKEWLERMEGFFNPVKAQENATGSYENSLKKYDEKLTEMRGHILKANDKGKSAQEMNQENKVFGYEALKKKLDEANKMDGQVEKFINEGRDYVDKANQNYQNASGNYDMLVVEIGKLRTAKSNLNTTVATVVSELERAQLPAHKAQGHAEILKNRADELDDLLADTRQVAENALEAANAYNNIVIAIDDAYNASVVAKKSAMRAVEMSEGISDQALDSQKKSEEKYGLAELRVVQVESELRPQLISAQKDVQNLKDINLYISGSLAVIDSGLESLQASSISEEAADLKGSAVESRESANEAILNIANIEDQLPQAAEEARALRKNIAEGQKAIQLAYKQVEEVEQVVPEMVELASTLRTRKDAIQAKGIDVGDRLEKLRDTIKKTRELANKIKVGVSFLPNTTLELQNPEDLSKAATATKVSFYVQTTEPTGLLVFMGTPVGGSQRMRRSLSDDFMALELDQGFLHLTMDLGAGAHTIEYNDLYIADGVWTQIIVERTGKVVKLSIQREVDGDIDAGSVEEVLPGRFSVFNLDPKVSKIFVGGIPAGVEIDKSIRSTSFFGQIEDLRINDRPLGLWNFIHNGTNNIYQRGALERDKLVDLKPVTGLRFDGNGYAALDTRNGYRFQKLFDIQIDFKTFAEDGILFMIVSESDQYMSVSLEEGHLLFQYDLGTGGATIRSENTYNDGQWHHVEVARQQKAGVLKIAQETIQGESGGSATQFKDIPEVMYFGGYPGEHEFTDITNDDFNGCMDNVILSSVNVDLTKSTESLGTVPGCPIQVASLVSFDIENPGYVRYDSPDGSGLQLVFKFKTDQPDGMIFYASTADQSSYLSLSMAESALILRAFPGGELTTGSFDRYNDSEWHVVIATREHNVLRLDIDDYKSYRVDVQKRAIPLDGPVFFGGVPDTYSIAAAASATDTNFYGCIGDATLNGRVVNFAQSTERPRALLQKCPIFKSTALFQTPSLGQRRRNISEVVDVPIIARGTLPPVDLEAEPEVEEDSEEYDYSTSQESFSVTPRSPFQSVTFLPPTSTFKSVFVTEETRPSVTHPILRDRCALPVEPATEEVDETSGFRFGSKRFSRIEFATLPDNARADFKFSFDMKTTADEGIIFYGSSSTHRDYVTFYLKDGKLVFSFNPGTGAALMRGIQPVNDGQWHTVVVERRGDYGVLYVDGYLVSNGTSKGESKFIDLESPYYYGGVNQEVTELVRQNTENTELSFNGCLRNIRMNNNRLGGKHEAHSLNRCSDKVETGVFFGEGLRSHVILNKRFSVGRVFEMSLDVKPRKNSGVIMSVHGRRDFVLLQLKDGAIEFSVDNGKGVITARYTLPSPWMICDGEWHTIQVIKTKNIAMLVVDGISTNPVKGKIGATSTDTKHPLFLGSQPRISARRGEATDEKFVGCVRNLTIKNAPADLAFATFVGNVDAGSCPTI